MYAWMARWMQNAPEDVRRPEAVVHRDPLADLLVFHGRAAARRRGHARASSPTRWIAAAKAQLAAGDRGVLAAALRHALGFGDVARGGRHAAKPARSRRRCSPAHDADVEPRCARPASTCVRVTFTPFDARPPAKVRHFDTYNRTAASQRVADIVAALRQSPSARARRGRRRGAAGAARGRDRARRQAWSTSAASTRRATRSSSSDLHPRPAPRRRFPDGRGHGRGEVVVHGAGDAFRVPGLRVDRHVLTPAQSRR